MTDTNIYDIISAYVPKTVNQQIATIGGKFSYHSRVRLDQLITFMLPTNVVVWVYLRFIANIRMLKSEEKNEQPIESRFLS